MTWMDIAPSPISLRDLLKAHQALPDMLAEPIALVRFANATRVGYLGTRENPGMVLLETPLGDGCLLVNLILKDKSLCESGDGYDTAKDLHERWFDKMKLRRVESRVTIDRTQTIRFLKAVGFHQETGPSGVRSAFLLNGNAVSIHVLGLLGTDKPRFRLKPKAHESNINTSEVSHAV